MDTSLCAHLRLLPTPLSNTCPCYLRGTRLSPGFTQRPLTLPNRHVQARELSKEEHSLRESVCKKKGARTHSIGSKGSQVQKSRQTEFPVLVMGATLHSAASWPGQASPGALGSPPHAVLLVSRATGDQGLLRAGVCPPVLHSFPSSDPQGPRALAICTPEAWTWWP